MLPPLGQAPVPPDVPITIGGVIAGMLVMFVMASSLVMIVFWGTRLAGGMPAMPAAARKPLYVPWPLTMAGIALALLMLLMVYGSEPAESNADQQATEEAQMTESDGAQKGPTDGEASVTDAGAAAEDLNRPSADGGADRQDDNSEKPVAGRKRKRYSEAQFVRMVLSTLWMNTLIFLVFGLTIFMVQEHHRRGLRMPDDVGYSELLPVRLSEADASPFPDLDAEGPFDGSLAGTPSSTVATAQSEQMPSPLSSAGGAMATAAEPWRFRTELRYATEAFLIAYLPTTLLRVFIAILYPQAPTHPFLEMLDEGIQPSLVGLIVFTAVVVAPVVEELHYRVTILGGLLQHRQAMAGWVISSVLFALVHGLTDGIALLPLSFALGYTFLRRRSYRSVILVHLIFNAFNMVVASAALL